MSNISQKIENKAKLKEQKIIFLVTQTKWGGAQKYVLELAKHFSQNNEVSIAYGEVKNKDPRFFDICQKNNLKTIPVNALVRNIDIAKDFSAVLEIQKILKQDNYNLIHLNSSKGGFVGAVAAKMHSANPMNLRLRIVYTAHGFVFNEMVSKLQKKLYKTAEMVSTSIEHLVIAVSDFDKQSAIEQKVVSPHKIFTVHNGINPVEYNFLNKEEAIKKLGLAPGKKYFGTVASFYDTKGHKYLVGAIKLLQADHSLLLGNWQWIFIGEGPNLEEIKKQVHELDLGDYIKFITPDNKDWQYLKAFDIFVLPSVKEGLPYTILEAGLAQVAVIASKVGGIPEVIKQEETGLLTTPANPLSLQKAMERMAQSSLKEKLVANNHQNILDNFSLAKTLEQTEELYLKLF